MATKFVTPRRIEVHKTPPTTGSQPRGSRAQTSLDFIVQVSPLSR